METKRNSDPRPLIAVIGGGAAGLAAAIAAAETARGAARVVVCEASDRVGRSILATGNGRCNFSNARLAKEARDGDSEPCDLAALYRNADLVRQVLAAAEKVGFVLDAAVGDEETNVVLRFFAAHGLVWREESEGRLYPLANKASSVLDVLRTAADGAGVCFDLSFPIASVERSSDARAKLVLRGIEGRELHADRVIVAAGGSVSEQLLAAFDVPFVAQRPVLGPLAVIDADKRLTKQLDNIRVKAVATLLREGRALRCEMGEALFRSYGLSGIAVFDLSREARPGDTVSLDLLPGIAADETASFLEQRAAAVCARRGTATYGDVLRGAVLPQVGRAICERVGARIEDTLDAKGMVRLAQALRDLRFTVEGIGDERQCQVMRGGVALRALDPLTLETRTVAGVQVVGEAVDVDGACGGYNLHWAWASGLLAGWAAAEAVS